MARIRRIRPLRTYQQRTPEQVAYTLAQLDNFQRRCVAALADQLGQDLNELPTVAYVPTHILNGIVDQ